VALQVFQNNKFIAGDTIHQGVEPISITNQNSEKAPAFSSTSDAIEIDGLIIDETRTKPARDFYELFYNKWAAPLNAKDYSITIKELPATGRSAQVVITVNDVDVFQQFLQPRIDVIEMMVDQAIAHIDQFLDNNESVKQQMIQEDSKGSGIF
jgi:curli production assembly/transport component CsgE